MQYYRDPEHIGVTVASIDHASVPLGRPQFRIFVKESPSWYQIPEDGLPRHDEFNPSFQKLLQ